MGESAKSMAPDAARVETIEFSILATEAFEWAIRRVGGSCFNRKGFTLLPVETQPAARTQRPKGGRSWKAKQRRHAR
jgi:hypothetical protein